jgi:hypothetical protein
MRGYWFMMRVQFNYRPAISLKRTPPLAVGDYIGKRVKVKGSSANVAAKRWVEAARFRGN